MSNCCISENEIPYIFAANECTIEFVNSTTDSDTSVTGNDINSLVFKNTGIPLENKCPLLNLDILDSLRYKSRYSTNDKNIEGKKHFYPKNYVKFFCLFMISKQSRN